jgi:uncharacterized protein (DUF58 family)
MVFTWNFLALLFGYAVILGLIRDSGNLGLLISLGLFGLWAADFHLNRKQPPFRAERRIALPVYQDQNAPVELVITNTLRRTVKLEYRDEPPFEIRVSGPGCRGRILLTPGQSVRISYSVAAAKRGKFAFGVLNLKSPGLLHLYQRVEKIPIEERTLEVYPDLSHISDRGVPPVVSSEFSGLHRQRVIAMAGEFAQIREYTCGDDFRKINWKVTAHTGKPVVNQFEPEKDQHVFLAIDSGRLLFDQSDEENNRLDHILDSALLLSYNIINSGDLLGALSFNTKVDRYLPAGKGRRHLQALIREFFDLQALMVESDYREAFRFWQGKVNKRCLLFVYTDITDAESSKELIDNLKLASRRHLVVCVLLQKEYLGAVMAEPLMTEATAYLKATAWELHTEREALKQLLALNGIKVLEVNAANIRRSVVEHYLYLKHSGLF